AHFPDQPLATMVAGPHSVSTARGFGRGHRSCWGQPRRGGGYPTRLRRDCGGIAAANRLDRWNEPLARRSGRDWRPKQLSRLPSSELVRNRVHRAVVDSWVSVLAGERGRPASSVLAALVLDRHARTSLRRGALCPAYKPVAALSGATPGLKSSGSPDRGQVAIKGCLKLLIPAKSRAGGNRTLTDSPFRGF